MYFVFLLIYSVAPTINPELMDQSHNKDDTVSFTCQADGEPLPTISWYFNGTPLDESDTLKYMITDNHLVTSVMNNLSVLNVQSSDVGTYTCNATNVVSTDTSSGVLTVNGELQFVPLCYVP